MQEVMHHIRKAAPEAAATAACLEKSMRLVDAYIKVCPNSGDCSPYVMQSSDLISMGTCQGDSLCQEIIFRYYHDKNLNGIISGL